MSIYKNLSDALGIDHDPSLDYLFDLTDEDYELNVYVPGAFTGQKHTQESKERISLANRGVPKSEEHKQKLRVPKPRIQCPHCLSMTDAANGKRWHFDNCPTYTGLSHPKQTEEHKIKRCSAGSKTRTGQKKRPHSEETKRKMRGPRGPNVRTKRKVLDNGYLQKDKMV